MSRILVTGASGFVGKHLIKRLFQNEEIYGIVKSNKAALRGLRLSKIYQADLSNYASVAKIITDANPDRIFHLAAYPDKGNNTGHIKAAFDSNVFGTLNLLMASRNINYKRFIFAGSYKEYGNKAVPFSEDSSLKPLSGYAASKAAAEQYCNLFQALGKPITMLRFATTYGPGQEQATLIASTIKSALLNEKIVITSGNQTRDFLYIDDAVSALIKSAYSPYAEGEIFNIGSGYEIKVKEIVKEIVKICKSKSKVKAGELPQRQNEVLHMYGNTAKAHKLLKWHPKTKLEDGLKRTVKWYKMQPGLL